MKGGSNSSRIAVNTLLLYVRSMVVLVVSLYTSRVVLRVLGVVDFGIYNVVGGVVAMLSFMTTSMSASFQRFFNYEMGRGDEKGVERTFRSAMTVELLFAAVVVVLAESVGLWFVNAKLTIAAERMTAANWVYQASIVAFVFAVMQSPFMALVIAYEKMNLFAFVSVLDAVLKLGIVLALQWMEGDKLVVYAWMVVSISLVNIVLYVVICKRRFDTCRFGLCPSGEGMRGLIGFGAWNMIDTLSYTLKSQGINIVLNMFFGPVVNAARGVAYQISGALSHFTKSFTTSFRPQLIKSYAEGDYEYVFKLYYTATKIFFYLQWCFTLPIILETDAILHLWLGENVPEYTTVFTRLVLMTSLVSAYANPTTGLAHATGRIREFTSVVSVLNLMIVPVAYVVLRLGGSPSSAMVVSLVITVLVQVCRLFVTKRLVDHSLMDYLLRVVAPTMAVAVVSFIASYAVKGVLPVCVLSALGVCGLSFMSVVVCAWVFGLNGEERNLAISKIKGLKKRFRRNMR